VDLGNGYTVFSPKAVYAGRKEKMGRGEKKKEGGEKVPLTITDQVIHKLSTGRQHCVCSKSASLISSSAVTLSFIGGAAEGAGKGSVSPVQGTPRRQLKALFFGCFLRYLHSERSGRSGEM